MTPAKRKKLKYTAANAAVLLCALAGAVLADPWQMYRRGEVPVWISPANGLEVFFSIVLGLSIIVGVQELGGDPAGKNQPKRIMKRCATAFISGAGARVMVG